jgi:hypothetical protein
MKDFISKLYLLLFMGFIVFYMYIIWNVTFGHMVEEYRYRKNTAEIAQNKAADQTEAVVASTFQKAILESDERVKHYLGYRVLEEKRIEGHFHHIDFDIVPDKRLYCIKCHGDMPHDKVKELRAFWNMHASFIACQTCHVSQESLGNTGLFKWYNRTTGEIVPSPVSEGKPGAYMAKIVPFEMIDGKLQRVDTTERMTFAEEYHAKEETLTELQKSKAAKIIHNVVSETPYACDDCHRREKPLLPLEELGYTKERIDSFESTEVVGMIKNYTKFYMPQMLHPGATEQ